jgi:hypothetical protein
MMGAAAWRCRSGDMARSWLNKRVVAPIILSSDEHVRTRYTFPSPEHIEFRDKMRRLVILNTSWMVFVICALIVFGIFAGKH